jgi:hypothetical protein
MVIPRAIEGTLDPEVSDKMIYNPLLYHEWKAFARHTGWALQDFAVSGWASRFGGKIFKDFYVYICLNGKNKRFCVDPHDSAWYDRLREDIATAAGNSSRASALRLYLGSEQLTGSAESLEALSNAGRNTLRIEVDSSQQNDDAPLAVPVRPVYAVNVEPSEDAEREERAERRAAGAPDASVDLVELDRTVRQLVEAFKASAMRELPAKLSDGGKELDYATLAQLIIKHISADAFYQRNGGFASFWNTLNCPDRAAAVNSIGRTIAAHSLKIEAGSPPEIYRQSLIGDNMWEKMRRRWRAWVCKARLYSPVPAPQDYQEPNDAYHCRQVAAPMEVPSVATKFSGNTVDLTTRLIECSRSSHSTSSSRHHQKHCDDSSDEEPTTESLHCGAKTRHMRRRKNLPPNVTVCDVALPNKVHCEPLKRCHHHHHHDDHEHQHQTQSQTIVLVPIGPDMLPIGKKLSASPAHPHPPPGTVNKGGGQRLYMNKDLHTSGTPFHPPRNQNVSAELQAPPPVADVACGMCGGHGHIKEEDQETKQTRHVACPVCGGKKKKDKEQEAAVVAGQQPSGPRYGGGGGGGSNNGGGGGSRGRSPGRGGGGNPGGRSPGRGGGGGRSPGRNPGRGPSPGRGGPSPGRGGPSPGRGGRSPGRGGRYGHHDNLVSGHGYGRGYGNTHPRWGAFTSSPSYRERLALRGNLAGLNWAQRRRLALLDAELMGMEMSIYGPGFVPYTYPEAYWAVPPGAGPPIVPPVYPPPMAGPAVPGVAVTPSFGFGAGVNAFGQPYAQLGPVTMVAASSEEKERERRERELQHEARISLGPHHSVDGETRRRLGHHYGELHHNSEFERLPRDHPARLEHERTHPHRHTLYSRNAAEQAHGALRHVKDGIEEAAAEASAKIASARPLPPTFYVRFINLTSDDALVVAIESKEVRSEPLAVKDSTSYVAVPLGADTSTVLSYGAAGNKLTVPGLKDGARFTVILQTDPSKSLVIEDPYVDMPIQGRALARIIYASNRAGEVDVSFELANPKIVARSFFRLSPKNRTTDYALVLANNYSLVVKDATNMTTVLASLPDATMIQRNSYTFVVADDGSGSGGGLEQIQLVDERFEADKYDLFAKQVDTMFSSVDVASITGGLMVVSSSNPESKRALESYTTNPEGGAAVLDLKNDTGDRIEFTTDGGYRLTFNKTATALVDKNAAEVPVQAIFPHPLNSKVLVLVINGSIDSFEKKA